MLARLLFRCDKPDFSVFLRHGSLSYQELVCSPFDFAEILKFFETHRWAASPVQISFGLAAELKTRRLLAVCGRISFPLWSDADSGKVIATPAICHGPDAAAFDPSFELFLRILWRRQPNVITKIPPTSTRWSKMCPTKKPLAPWAVRP